MRGVHTRCFHLSGHTRALPDMDTQISQPCFALVPFLFRMEVGLKTGFSPRDSNGSTQRQLCSLALITNLESGVF